MERMIQASVHCSYQIPDSYLGGENMRRKSKAMAAVFSATAAAVANVLVSNTAHAQVDAMWTNPGAGDFNVPTNWSTNAVPGSADTAEVNNGGTVDITSADPLWTVNQAYAGNGSGAVGTIYQTGGTFNNSFTVVGRIGATGTYNITGGILNQTAGSGAIRLFGNATAGVSATNMYISGTAAVNNSGEFDVGYNNGTVTGAASLTMSGGTLKQSGSLIIGNGSNTYGNFTLNGGTITATGNIEIGEGNSANGTMVMNGGTINETGQFRVADAANANNQTGATGSFTMNGGTITSNNWFVIGRGGSTTGTLIMNGNASIVHTNDGNNGNSFEVGSYGGNNGTPNNATLVMNGSSSLTTGYIRDESPNGGTQQIYLNGGTLISNAGDGGFLGGHVNGGDTLAVYLQNGGVTLNAGGDGGELGITIPISHSNIATDNAIDGGIKVVGGGNVTLQTGSNTFTGNIVVTNSELQVGYDSSFGLGNSITLNNGELHNDAGNGQPSDIELGNSGVSRTIYVNGTGYLTPGWSGWSDSAPIVNAPGSTGPNNLSVPFDSGTLTLNASNSYSGSTTIGSIGIPSGPAGNYYWNSTGATVGLQLGNDNALPAGTELLMGTHPLSTTAAPVIATFDMNGHQATIGGLVGYYNDVIDNKANGSTSTLTLGAAVGYSAALAASNTFNYGGIIQNSGGTLNIVKTGPAIQVFSGPSTYTGSTTVNSGKLYINGSLNGSSGVTVNAGTIGGTGFIYSPVSVASGATVEGGYLGSGTLTIPGTLSVAGGSTILVGNLSNYNSPSAAAISVGTLALNGGTVNISGGTATSPLTVGSTFDVLSYTTETGTTPTYNLELPSRATGTLSDSGNLISVTITGLDYINWTGNTNGTWDTTTPNWALNSSGAVTTYIDNPGDSVVFGDSAKIFNVSLGSAMLHPSAVTFNNSTHAYALTGTGGIAGLEGLTKMGSNVLYLDTANTYTGTTAIQNGTLALGTGGSISAQSAVVLGNGSTSGVLQLGDTTGPVSTTLNSLTVSGTGTSNAVIGGNAAVSTLTLTNPTVAYNGLLGSGTAGATPANALALSYTGAGTITLTNVNTYTGGTTMAGGTLNVNNNSAIGTGNLTFTSSSTLQAAANVTLANNLVLNTTDDTFDTNGHVLTLNGSITNVLNEGDIITAVGNGTLVLGGTLNVLGSAINDSDHGAVYMATTGPTTTITGTGTLSGITMAWHDSNNTLNLAPAGTLTLTNTDTSLDVGQQGGNGAVTQSAGTVTMVGNLYLGQWDSSYGSYAMTGGTLNFANGYWGAGGNGNGNSLFTMSAGTVNAGNYTTLGQNGAGFNTYYQTGGTYNNTGNAITLGNGGGSTATLTMAGGLLNNSGQQFVLAGNNNAASTTILNLNGGTLITNQLFVRNSQPDSIVNFNGGTLQASASNTAFLAGATTANIYSGGAIINSNGSSITISQNLVSAGGSGGLNTNVPVAAGGSGYVGAPVVNITGGGGTGATALATVANGVVTGITLTSAGTGYTSSPTSSFYGGGGTGVTAGTYNPTPNAADGGLTKLGTGNLTLSGNNSYTGNTQIQGGTLTVASNTALGTGHAVLSTNTTLALAYVPSTPAGAINFNANGGYYTNTNGNGGFSPIISASGTSVQLTSAQNSEATSVFSPGTFQINDATGFIASFTYTHATSAGLNGVADGVMFVVQSVTANALGLPGGDLGYANSTTAAGIPNSVAAGLELYSDKLETGENGFLTNVPADNTTPFLSQSTSDTITVVYNGPAETLTETVVNNFNGATATITTTGIDLANDLSGNAGGTGYGYIGFTGSTGGLNDTQSISSFQFNNNGTTLPNSPTTNTLAITNQIVVLPAASSTIQLGGNATTNFSSGTVGPISIGSGGTLAISGATAGGTHGLLATPSVTFSNASSGQLDIANNALDITSQSLATVSAAVASAYKAGTWTGPGITSSLAASNSSHLTAVGVMINDTTANTSGSLSGTAIYSAFDGGTPNDGDILVKYTYYGDANLDGKVDGSDYSLIDNGALMHLTGWYNGDFNYDGVINGSDYTLIDNAYNTQGASLAAEIGGSVASVTAQVAGGSSVPEPTTLGLLAIGAAGLLGRRRRHQ
jgi:autotransporter-associated beta strand protein